jgi:protein involved in polysaccharide export with SLBB domain
LLRDPYLLFGVLETTDPLTSARRYFPLSLQNILQGVEDYRLRDGDKVIVLSKMEIEYLSSLDVQRIISFDPSDDDVLVDRSFVQNEPSDEGASPSTTVGTLQRLAASVSRGPAGESTEGAAVEDDGRAEARFDDHSCASLRQLGKLVSETRSGRFSNAVVAVERRNRQRPTQAAACVPIYEENPGLLSFVLEHGAAITGEVRAPGIYPVVPSTGLASIVGVAGGLTREVDFSRIELSKFAGNDGNERQQVDASSGNLDGVLVGPGDVVRFNAVFSDRDSGPVFLIGEFIRPGSYEIRRGERLSEVVARAGGLTVQAYPFGAIFTRQRVQRAERESLRRLARELNAAVTVAAANRGIDAGAITSFASLTQDISEAPASGRVVIEADPTILQVRPELDIVLEPGDRVFMPKRPNSVLVTGDVLNPGAMQFVTGKPIDTYIRQAGGFQQSADRNRLFVVFPNGVAQPVSVSAFNYTPLRVPPGSAIVVPKDATPFDLFTISRELSTVLSQLAITAASLAVIGNN